MEIRTKLSIGKRKRDDYSTRRDDSIENIGYADDYPMKRNNNDERRKKMLKEGDIINLSEILFTEDRDFLIKYNGQQVSGLSAISPSPILGAHACETFKFLKIELALHDYPLVTFVIHLASSSSTISPFGNTSSKEKIKKLFGAGSMDGPCMHLPDLQWR